MKALVLSFALAVAPCPVFALTFTVAIDLSSSSAIHDPDHAAAAARYVQKRMSTLKSGDRVVVRVFGDGSNQNAARIEGVVSAQKRGSAWGAAIGARIVAISKGALGMQEMTRIAEFLEWTDIGCKSAGGGELMILSDALEHSSYVTERAFRSGAPLPAPERGDLFAGCTIRFVGLGVTMSGEIPGGQRKAVEASWRRFVEQGGGAFDAIGRP